jgi:hypothetical protein
MLENYHCTEGGCGTIVPAVSFLLQGTRGINEDTTMKKLQTGLAAAALAATGAVQADAAPIFLPKIPTVQSDVIQVGHRYRYRNWYPAGAFVAGALIGGALANSNRYYGGGYYGGGYYNSYYGGGYYNNYYGGGYYPRYYRPRYYAPAGGYYPPRGSAYRQGYRDGFRDGANARYYDDITCTTRLQDAGKC